ncbi:MAG: SRPBCC family protein [Myxococcales bacterium]|nr:SRPBCC family protein [Myxococcales bacterium]
MLMCWGCLAAVTAHADAPELDKAVHIHLERTVEASADRAWQFLGERFERLGEWSDGLDSRALRQSEVPDGMTVDPEAPVAGRVVNDGRREQIQVLVDFDSASRSFTFQAGNPPGALAYAHNRHAIVDLGGERSRIDIDVVLQPRGIARLLKGTLERKFTAYMQAYLDQAEAGIEGSAPVDGGNQ